MSDQQPQLQVVRCPSKVCRDGAIVAEYVEVLTLRVGESPDDLHIDSEPVHEGSYERFYCTSCGLQARDPRTFTHV